MLYVFEWVHLELVHALGSDPHLPEPLRGLKLAHIHQSLLYRLPARCAVCNAAQAGSERPFLCWLKARTRPRALVEVEMAKHEPYYLDKQVSGRVDLPINKEGW